MESLSYTFEGRGPPFTDDIELQMDDLVRSRTLLKEWDAFEGMGFVGPDLPEISRKSVVSAQCLENSVDDANGDLGKSVPSTSTISLNSSTEIGMRIPSSAVKTDDEKAETGLKIDKLVTSRESKRHQVSVENSGKRARITNLPSQIPVCIVQGCNKDLSNSKEYHKRHKVCEIHSKTAVVIVNGIQQRFCQQCSRFHVLPEFDEGKRSCRKRLAGHNARRRKPQVDNYFGSSLFGTDYVSSTSLLFSKILFGQQCHEPANQSRHVKLEEEPSRTTQLTLPLKFDHSLPKDLLHLHEMGKRYPSKNCVNSPLSVLESSAGSNSSCALSLLSPQSQNFSTYNPLIFEEHQHTKPSAKMTPKYFTPGICSSSSSEVNRRFHDTCAPLGFGSQEDRLPGETNAPNPKHHPSHEGANTLDLFQLSLHLQRVEQQKYSSQVKPDDTIFCHSTTT
ncbi:hypothetical protein CDL12_30326 [Handroanthus impetiginosus]|uniref:SBP-type domain-containing protein n=1 Tax=Handroanthus impetiginosus TaxID=429701 RepID=A0A2G9FVV6_9LAMI|nr:hypothetical protein CDL12_30326 [Handroanthus impetiginosus]